MRRMLMMTAGLALAGCDDLVAPVEPTAYEVRPPPSVDAGLDANETIARDAGPRRPRPTQRADIPSSRVVAAPQTGVDLGWGWRSVQGEAVPARCVTFERADAEGQTVSLIFEEVQDSFEMASALDMSASASVKGIGYAVSGEEKFVATSKIKATESTFVIAADVMNPARFAAPPPDADAVRLTPEARALAMRADGLVAFKQACGDGYVGSMTTGARFTALVAVKTASRQDKATLTAKVEGGGWGVKVNAAMNAESSSSRDSMSRRITVHQDGGAPAPIPMSAEEIVEHAKGLATLAADGGKLFRLSVTPYQMLGDWPAERDMLGASLEFEQIAELHGAYAAIYAEIDAALDAPGDYVAPISRACPTNDVGCVARDFQPLDKPFARSIAEGVQDEARAAMERLRVEAQRCVVAAESCALDETRFRSPYALRSRAPVLISLVTPETDADPGQYSNWLQLYVEVMLRQPSRSRCRIDPFLLGCLSNAELREWEARVGLATGLAPPGLAAAGAVAGEPGPSGAGMVWFAHP